MWNLLIHRDNWQGEFAVALFSAIGWATISALSRADLEDMPRYVVLSRIAPEVVWECWLLIFGAMQMIGLLCSNAAWRAAGAAGVCMALVCIALAVAFGDPGARSIGFCLASICVEFCAVVFHTGRMVRNQEYSVWPWTTKPSA